MPGWQELGIVEEDRGIDPHAAVAKKKRQAKPIREEGYGTTARFQHVLDSACTWNGRIYGAWTQNVKSPAFIALGELVVQLFHAYGWNQWKLLLVPKAEDVTTLKVVDISTAFLCNRQVILCNGQERFRDDFRLPHTGAKAAQDGHADDENR